MKKAPHGMAGGALAAAWVG
ncbi:hypothetical protein GFL03_18985 [Pseudomonas stutzeri]|nr:hypothetical protein [Stutzerimonas frequens]RRV72041.1 hypothetical protein EGJ18_18035 [Stutzerimonas stutzeri]